MTNEPQIHNSRTCPLCAPLLHPSNHLTRRALRAIPRQSVPVEPHRSDLRTQADTEAALRRIPRQARKGGDQC